MNLDRILHDGPGGPEPKPPPPDSPPKDPYPPPFPDPLPDTEDPDVIDPQVDPMPA